MQYNSDVFVKDTDLTWEQVSSSVRRKIMAYDNQIMLVKAEFAQGGVGPIHDHFHSQVTYVESGVFEVSIGSEKKILTTGDAFYIPPHVPHGAVALEGGVLVDVFSPIREDFMTTAHSATEPANADSSTQ
ncbi:cupin domain-containing protein [Rudanella lutea]|uniref:cupin domain-containing protein n=1 Tax=Rudanella lutea TaxID=451374 RepID=UPI000363CE20|nr:cupin domain-containing protein [Rudanella lutea]